MRFDALNNRASRLEQQQPKKDESELSTLLPYVAWDSLNRLSDIVTQVERREGLPEGASVDEHLTLEEEKEVTAILDLARKRREQGLPPYDGRHKG